MHDCGHSGRLDFVHTSYIPWNLVSEVILRLSKAEKDSSTSVTSDKCVDWSELKAELLMRVSPHTIFASIMRVSRYPQEC